MTADLIPASDRRPLLALLAVFVAIGGLYSASIPLFEISDEYHHYPFVRELAAGGGLPVQDPASPGPWRQEGSQPPLYYAIGALATFWIDTTDFEQVWQLNPHVDSGVITADGNTNLIVHNPVVERWPWRGTTLAVRLVRFLSVLMGAGVVYFTYRIGSEILRGRRWLALAGAAAVAFTPMFVFISGSVNNDTLAILIASAAVWLMIRMARRAEEGQPTGRQAAALGLLLGLGALTKLSTLGLFGLAGLTAAYAAWQRRRWRVFLVEGLLVLALAGTVAGWWYVRNWLLYGEWLGLETFVAIVGGRPNPVTLAQLWGEREGFMASYWGLFGALNVPLPGWAYAVLNTLAGLSILGLILMLALRLSGLPLAIRPRRAPAALTLLWIPAVILPLIRWTSLTTASQGRLAFSAISALSLWFLIGLSVWLPERWAKAAAGAVLGFLATLTIAAPFAWIIPAYRPPAPADPTASLPVADFTPPGADEPALRLLAAGIGTQRIEPGGAVPLNLTWEVVTPMDRNWSIFVHLRDSAGTLAGQRDMYPGLGLLATGDLEAGRRWNDQVVVPVGDTAYSPETLDVVVGLYDLSTGERMLLDDGRDAIVLGQVRLVPRSGGGQLPNPVAVNYENQLQIVGYEISPRRVRPDRDLTVTLYWEALADMDANYTVSVQVLGPDEFKAGQQDGWPVSGRSPTSLWLPGDRIADPVTLHIAPDAPPGLYDLQVIVYNQEDGSITLLRQITSEGQIVDDPVLLTQVRVLPR